MTKKRVLHGIGIFCLTIIVGLLVACQGNVLSYKGELVEEKNQVPLKAGGPHSEVWNTRNVIVSYDYVNKADRLDITGEVALAGGAENFQYVEHLEVNLYFVDGNGRIIEYVPLFSAVTNDMGKNWSFQRNIEKPVGAESMAFGYSGQVQSIGSDQDRFDFWETPI